MCEAKIYGSRNGISRGMIANKNPAFVSDFVDPFRRAHGETTIAGLSATAMSFVPHCQGLTQLYILLPLL